jgi:hypothetical protein
MVWSAPALQLLVARRGDDGGEARRLGDLQAQHRNAPCAEQQDRVAGLDLIARFENGVPCGNASARQRAGIDVAERLRQRHQRVLVEADFLCQHPVHVAAEGVANLLRRGGTIVPAREEGRCDAVAGLVARDTMADLDHLAGAVRTGNDRIVHRHQVVAAGDHQVAVIQRDGVHPDPHFAGSQRAAGQVHALQSVDVFSGNDLVSLHAASVRWAREAILRARRGAQRPDRASRRCCRVPARCHSRMDKKTRQACACRVKEGQ